MDVAEQLMEEWNRESVNTRKTTEFVLKCRERLSRAFDTGQELDPRDEGKAVKAGNECGTLAKSIEANDAVSAARSLLTWAWCEFGTIQRKEKRWVYRAGLSMYLAEMYLRSGVSGAAMRWALHTHADDLMGGNTQGGKGKQILSCIMGMSGLELSQLDEVAAKNREAMGETKDWASPFGFCEHVVLQFSQERPHAAHLFTLEPSIIQFPLSPGYYEALLTAAEGGQPNSTAKGAAYEDVASYLFMLIPGWVPLRNLHDLNRVHEHDLVMSNVNQAADVTTELLGRHFLVECKNWNTRVGTPEVGYFLYRMRLTHARFGVIFVRDRVTGKVTATGATNAQGIIRRAFHEDGSLCVVVTLEDLHSLRSGDAKFWPMLLQRIESLRFGEPWAKSKPPTSG